MVTTRRARRAVVWLAIAAVVGTSIALLQFRTGDPAQAAVRIARATVGDVVLTVGGLGRVVEAREPVQSAVPSGGSSAAGSSQTVLAGAVLPRASGQVSELLVAPGDLVTAGQPVALLEDGGTTQLGVRQARYEVATAKLELTQKRTNDPMNGPPPTSQEVTAAQLAVSVAQQRLGLIQNPSNADVDAARLDTANARAALRALLREPSAEAFAAAELAVQVAADRLAQVNGPPSAADVAAAQLELARAEAELAALLQTPVGPSSAAIQASQLAVQLATERLAALDPAAPPDVVLAAQLELAQAQAALDALMQSPTPGISQAITAAQLAVDLARQRLAELTGPPNQLTVNAAELELGRAQAELETLRASLPSAIAVEAGELAVSLMQERLSLLRNPPASVLNAGRFEVASAAANLEMLLRRGGPASAVDLALAELKLAAAKARVALARAQSELLTVRSPFRGTVTAVLAAPGTPADVATPIATVVDLRHLAVTVDLSEFDVAQVTQGLPAMVSVDALGGRTYGGEVTFASLAGIDNGGVVTFPVRVELPRRADVRLGMNCSVRIIVQDRQDVLRVPLEAVTSEGGSSTVTVMDASGQTSVREVTLGLADNTYVEIIEGLDAGEQVVLAADEGGEGD